MGKTEFSVFYFQSQLGLDNWFLAPIKMRLSLTLFHGGGLNEKAGRICG
jgi:hypothetical protein